MAHTLSGALRDNFLGNSPIWYKNTIIGFLILNPILVTFDPFIAG
jgi:NhaB family Na+:H+ antiporter